MLAYFDLDSSIWKTTVFIIKVDTQRAAEFIDFQIFFCLINSISFYFNGFRRNPKQFSPDFLPDKMETGERLIFQSQALTDKVKLEIEDIQKADNTYRGALEFWNNNSSQPALPDNKASCPSFPLPVL